MKKTISHVILSAAKDLRFHWLDTASERSFAALRMTCGGRFVMV
jgi:hypothetical protein